MSKKPGTGSMFVLDRPAHLSAKAPTGNSGNVVTSNTGEGKSQGSCYHVTGVTEHIAQSVTLLIWVQINIGIHATAS